MGQRLAALTLCVLTVAARTWSADQEVRSAPAKAALAFFMERASEGIDTVLARLRPEPLDPASRARLLASLPKEFDLQPSPAESAKIAEAERMLEYSARGGAISIKVMDLHYAYGALYFRSAILMSRPMFAILDGEEFVAIAAHEVGHDYHWDLHWAAQVANDHSRRQELELRADGVAVLTLRGMGLSPDRLISAIEKTVRFNQTRIRARSSEDYVPLAERRAFIRAVASIH